MSLSSAEGLRAAAQGAVLAGPKARPQSSPGWGSFRLRRAGPFRGLLGHQVESSSGGRLQLLNFGVGGYGVDQAYLRFKKDALAWEPDVAVLAFPLTDLFAKHDGLPVHRMASMGHTIFEAPDILENGALRTLNPPTLPPPVIFQKASIDQLPFLEFDLGYRRHEWEWGVADAVLGKRWLFSFFPRYVERNTNTSDEEMIAVNRAILLEFTRLAKENRVQPIIAYLPGKPEILRLKRGDPTDGQRIMRRIGFQPGYHSLSDGAGPGGSVHRQRSALLTERQCCGGEMRRPCIGGLTRMSPATRARADFRHCGAAATWCLVCHPRVGTA